MEDEFTFSSLIKPGVATRQAVERELHRRKEEDDKRWRWEPGYVYTGTADLLLKHGQWFVGRVLPDEYEHLRGPMTRCFENGLEAAEQDSSLRYFQGVYCAGTQINGHAWCVAPDGGVVELTHTTHATEGGRVVALSDRRGGSVPYLAPERTVYCGVEFEIGWARRWIDSHNLVTILDPRALDPGDPDRSTSTDEDSIFRHLYSRSGVPLP